MSWLLVVALALMAGAGVVWSRTAHTGADLWEGVSPTGLERHLDRLLRGDARGSVLTIRRGRSEGDGFVQFARYEERRTSGLRFAFPLAPWTGSVYPKLKHRLDERGFEAVTVPPGSPGAVEEFLLVDCGADIGEATRVAVLAADVVFGASPNEPVLAAYLSERPVD